MGFSSLISLNFQQYQQDNFFYPKSLQLTTKNKMKKYTIEDFKNNYPSDQVCLDKIFQLRYGKLEACPKCACVASWKRIPTRRCYQCRHCYEQFYPTAGTVFEKMRMPLSSIFYVIYLFTVTRNGVAAKEIERQLGCTYKTAWRMGHVIRQLMNKIGQEKLKGFVEVDETYYSKGKKPGNPGRSSENQSAIVAMVERTGEARAQRVESVNNATVLPLIEKHVDKSAHISTDELHIYKNLNKLGYEHGSIMHAMKIYREGVVTTNTVEGLFSNFKRMIPTHIHISHKYLNNYLGEFIFRYNNRKKQDEMFEKILLHLPLAEC